MLVFVVFQLVFFARGVTFSPWYNFGMFSAVMKIEPYYTVYKLPGRLPENIQLLSPQWDDKVYFTLDQYHNTGLNDSMYQKVKKIFHMAHLPKPDSLCFVYSEDSNSFRQWFSNYASPWVIINKHYTAGAFEQIKVRWDGKMLSSVNNIW